MPDDCFTDLPKHAAYYTLNIVQYSRDKPVGMNKFREKFGTFSLSNAQLVYL